MAELNPPSRAAVSRGQAIGLVLLLAAACVLPFMVSNYRVFQLTLALVYAIALLGLNMLTGYNGQISLGHGAFYAIGAYVAAILMDKFGVPYWLTVPAAGAVCLVAGFLFGLPALRLEGVYLALATFVSSTTSSAPRAPTWPMSISATGSKGRSGWPTRRASARSSA